jgi:two-component system response regulator FlrC
MTSDTLISTDPICPDATAAWDRVFRADPRRELTAGEREARLDARVRTLTAVRDPQTGARYVIGESATWAGVLRQAVQVAPTSTTVLLLGESGTGKEVLARFLHRASSRDRGPFVALNCAALPDQLLEAELFGYERGAFTGANQSKPGLLEQASGGTLFLDEVGEMSPASQAKLLRVLQEREFQRLGGTRTLRTDVRIVAATNRSLDRAIADGQFREDLFYRLNVFPIRLPALRERRDDILPLAEGLLAVISRDLGRPAIPISREAAQALIGHAWPGNVRELRNVLERAAILADGAPIGREHLSIEGAPGRTTPGHDSRRRSAAPTSAADLQSLERMMIEQALAAARFNKAKAARTLGLTRRQLYVRLRRFALDA